MIGNRATVAELAIADARQPVLDRLQLDPVNPRSAGVPFYLFARAQTVEALRRNPSERRRVAFGVSNQSRDLFDATEASVVLERILGTRPEVVRTTNDHGELLDYLLAPPGDQKRVDLVGIYDEDPSVLLHDFLETYRPRAPIAIDALRVQLYLLPTKDRNYAPQLQRAGQTGSTFAIVPDEKLRFYDLTGILPADGSDGFVTLSPSLKATSASGRTDIPVMLSNARTILGDTAAARRDMARFQQIVSFGYLATLLTDEVGKRCQGMTSPLFQTYLLQAFFADTQSLPKGLSLWSNLQFTAAPAPRSKQQPPVESDLIERMVNERLRALNTSTRQLDYRKVVDTMAPRRASVPVREQFTHDDAGMFRRAVDQVRLVVDNPQANPQALAEARRSFIELLVKNKGPACVLPGLGLFGERGYDPFFYLSVIDSLLSLQPAG